MKPNAIGILVFVLWVAGLGLGLQSGMLKWIGIAGGVIATLLFFREVVKSQRCRD